MSFTVSVSVPVELVSGEFEAIARVTVYAPPRSYLQPSDPPCVTWERVLLNGEQHDPLAIEERFAINLDEWDEEAIERASALIGNDEY